MEPYKSRATIWIFLWLFNVRETSGGDAAALARGGVVLPWGGWVAVWAQWPGGYRDVPKVLKDVIMDGLDVNFLVMSKFSFQEVCFLLLFPEERLHFWSMIMDRIGYRFCMFLHVPTISGVPCRISEVGDGHLEDLKIRQGSFPLGNLIGILWNWSISDEIGRSNRNTLMIFFPKTKGFLSYHTFGMQGSRLDKMRSGDRGPRVFGCAHVKCIWLPWVQQRPRRWKNRSPLRCGLFFLSFKWIREYHDGFDP